MKKLAYVAGLFALTCAPLLAALYEGLEVGMDKDQVLKTLRRSKQLEGPPTDALLARTGLNGVFKTRQAIGGQTFALNFDYDPSGGLRAVVFYSRSKHRGSEYETKLKSAYKALLVGLTEQFGEPVNMPGNLFRKAASSTCTCGRYLPAFSSCPAWATWEPWRATSPFSVFPVPPACLPSPKGPGRN